jgi:methylamine dehydrogenase accessory protein MauD
MGSMQGWWIASYVILWFLVVVLSVLVVALARQVGTLHLRLGPRGALEIDDEGPPLGESPPVADVRAIDDRMLRIGGPGPANVLLFVSPGCHLCEAVLPSLGVAAKSKGMNATVLVDADRLETIGMFGDRKLNADIAPAGDLTSTYAVPGTPFVVVLDDLGIVRAKGTVNNLEQLEGLIDTALQRELEKEMHAV